MGLQTSFGWSCCDKCFSALMSSSREIKQVQIYKIIPWSKNYVTTLSQAYADTYMRVGGSNIQILWTDGHSHPKHCTGLCPLHTEDSSYTRTKYLTAGTAKSWWCQHLEVWKNFSYLLTELLSPFFSYSFLFHKFYKLLPCLKGDPENPPLRIKRKNVKYWGKVGFPSEGH